MVSKRHQEEISGPQDTLSSAPFAIELRTSKRSKQKSRKVVENETQKDESMVLSSFQDISTISGTTDPLPQRKRANWSEKKALRTFVDTSNEETTPKWYTDYQKAPGKPEKLKILLQSIGPTQPFPQKLKTVGILPADGIPFAKTPFTFDPLELFHTFVPR